MKGPSRLEAQAIYDMEAPAKEMSTFVGWLELEADIFWNEVEADMKLSLYMRSTSMKLCWYDPGELVMPRCM